MKKLLILGLTLTFLPIHAMAFEVNKFVLTSTVKIISHYSPEIIDKRVAEIYDDAGSEGAQRYRQDLQEGKLIGSGVVLTYDGCVLTSAHVLVDQETGLYYQDPVLYYGTEVKAEPKEVGGLELVFISEQADLAVACLKDTKGKFFHPATLDYDLKDLTLTLGTEIYALGFPTVYGDFVKLAKGVIAGYVKDEPLTLTSMTFSPGMSGGPVFDMSNRVVSLVTGRANDFSFGAILDPAKFLNWREQLFSAVQTYQPQEFKNCNLNKDNYFEKEGKVYYEANCKTVRNPGLDAQVMVDYKNICGKKAILDEQLHRQASQYIASNKSNLIEWQKYLEWLCLR